MSAADRPYTNQSTRRDKAEALKADTYFNRAQIDADLDAPGGRFREKETITGSQASTKYPCQDSASPWSGGGADPGVEPPLGVEINAQEPVGEAHEIEASLAASSNPALSQQVRTASVEDDGAASQLAEAVGSDSTANAVVKSQAANSPACAETASANPNNKMRRRKVT
jgi:hypothetical protein